MDESRFLERAFALMAVHRHRQAMEVLGEALAGEPANATVCSLLAWCIANSNGDLDQAEQLARRGIELAPDVELSYSALSVVLKARNQIRGALQAIDQAIAINPSVAKFHGLRAQLLMISESWNEARIASEAGLALDPENNICLAMRSALCAIHGDWGGSLAAATSHLSIHPDSANAHSTRGWALLFADEFEMAADAFREALRLDPNKDGPRRGLLVSLGQSFPPFRLATKLYRFWTNGGKYNHAIIPLSFFPLNLIIYLLARTDYPMQATAIWVHFSYLAMGWLFWAAWPLSILLLRLYPPTRMLLTRRERWQCNLAWGLTVFWTLAAVIAGWIAGTGTWTLPIGASGFLITSGFLIPLTGDSRTKTVVSFLVGAAITTVCMTVLVGLMLEHWNDPPGFLRRPLAKASFQATIAMLTLCILGIQMRRKWRR